MRWWTHLYMGDRAAKRGAAVLRNIREQKILPDTYVITPSSYGHHLFDIRPVMLLRPEERTSEDFLVLGVACCYGEAGEVVRRMVDDMYRATGAFDWNAYMELAEADGQDMEEQMGE